MTAAIQCKCARVAYRNNNDGSRDYKIVGDARCKVCRGSGYFAGCPLCNGAGMFKSKVCTRCGGPGKIRVENPGFHSAGAAD